MESESDSKLRTIIRLGWQGHCPRCQQGNMFQSWLKIADKCEVCGLSYDFATPDDGPAFFSLCFVAFPLLFVVVWLQVAVGLPTPILLAIAIPLMVVGCLLPLRPIKGWLVASQYLNRSVEAGTEQLWKELNKNSQKEQKSADEERSVP